MSIKLTAGLYIAAFNAYGIKIKGGTIHDFLRMSHIEYHGGKCPVYYVCAEYGGTRIVVGGNYATNGKPELQPLAPLNFD